MPWQPLAMMALAVFLCGCMRLDEPRNAIPVDPPLATCLRQHPLLRSLDGQRLEDTGPLRECLHRVLGLRNEHWTTGLLSRWGQMGFVCGPTDASQSVQCVLNHRERIYGIGDRSRFNETQSQISIQIIGTRITSLLVHRATTYSINDVNYEVISNNLI